MTKKEHLHVVKPTTTVDEGVFLALICSRPSCILRFYVFVSFFLFQLICVLLATALETLVENRITGFPVIDDDWKLVTQPSYKSFYFATHASKRKTGKKINP